MESNTTERVRKEMSLAEDIGTDKRPNTREAIKDGKKDQQVLVRSTQTRGSHLN